MAGMASREDRQRFLQQLGDAAASADLIHPDPYDREALIQALENAPR